VTFQSPILVSHCDDDAPLEGTALAQRLHCAMLAFLCGSLAILVSAWALFLLATSS